MADRTLFNWTINNAYIPPSGLVISNVFDLSHQDTNIAPIDTFIQKNVDLNKLLLDPNNLTSEIDRLQSKRKISNHAYTSIKAYINSTANVSPVLANLILLGHISAVESYFREMFRRVILIDEQAQEVCREKALSYGAAITHKLTSLPDALLEQINFASSYNITEALKEYLGIKGNYPTGLTTGLTQYSKICQLRHCIIHRFGKLGINNAMKIDWHTHKVHVEKPIKIDFNSLQEVSQVCVNIVKEINNYVWQTIMMRQIADGNYNNFSKKGRVVWTWNWAADRARFKNYFSVFISTLAPPPVTSMKLAYESFKLKYTNL